MLSGLTAIFCLLKQITDLPPGRIPVETHVIEGNEQGFQEMYKVNMAPCLRILLSVISGNHKITLVEITSSCSID